MEVKGWIAVYSRSGEPTVCPTVYATREKAIDGLASLCGIYRTNHLKPLGVVEIQEVEGC